MIDFSFLKALAERVLADPVAPRENRSLQDAISDELVDVLRAAAEEVRDFGDGQKPRKVGDAFGFHWIVSGARIFLSLYSVLRFGFVFLFMILLSVPALQSKRTAAFARVMSFSFKKSMSRFLSSSILQSRYQEYSRDNRLCQEIFSYISIFLLNLLIIIRIIASREAGFLRRIGADGKVKMDMGLFERKKKKIG